ncbi:MAG: class 3 adenylate cyclase [Myxococcota bacterium]|jgi:class 3 adenylate cyclase
MTPTELFDFLNQYFGAMVPLVREHKGFVDKYIGDALMALYPGGITNGLASAMARAVRAMKPVVGKPVRMGVGLPSARCCRMQTHFPPAFSASTHHAARRKPSH